jgi:hypothetical protein
MRTPRYVAGIGAGTLIVTLLVTSIVRELVGSWRDDAFLSLATQAFGCFFLGALVWVGTYLGARYSVASHRNDRLVRVLSLSFIVVGVLLSLPIETHAVKLDMPPAGSAPPDIDVGTVFLPLSLLLLTVIIPFVLTRVLAATVGKAGASDA